MRRIRAGMFGPCPRESEREVTDPLSCSTAAFLFDLADRQSILGVDWIRTQPEIPGGGELLTVSHAEQLKLIERLGTGLDRHYVRLTTKGKSVVQEGLCAMRDVK